MFNFFNFKSKKLIPADIDKSIMSSNFCTIKLGEKLELKENLNCLICYKDKIYYELQQGNYHLTRELLIDLYSKQAKNNKKLKKLKADLYFANTNLFSFSFNYVDKIPLNNQLTKIIFDVDTKIKINDVREFYGFIVSEDPQVDAYSAEQMITNFVIENIKNHFLKVELNSLILPNDNLNEIKQKLTNKLNKIGLVLIDLNLKLSTKTKLSVEKPKSSFFEFDSLDSPDTIEEKTENNIENLVDQPKNLDYTNNEQTNESSTNEQVEELKNCPICKCKLVKGSAFCHRCGYKIKEIL